ncbi:MAG: chemotaxis protein CheW [Planctomycetota bacterium]|nr:purine-binding chemotaxis protein CheW [Planctomycetota bacterium]
MQLLTFSVAGHAYAIESRKVIEVLPAVAARPIPHTPAYVRGIFTYRGRLVPLVDLGLRLAAAPPAERLSTRVIVVELSGRDATERLLGLVAENVISICSAEAAEASLPPLDVRDAPFLGQILRIGGRTIQLITTDHLLPADVSTSLFTAGASAQP